MIVFVGLIVWSCVYPPQPLPNNKGYLLTIVKAHMLRLRASVLGGFGFGDMACGSCADVGFRV